jgi:hypothetical protein
MPSRECPIPGDSGRLPERERPRRLAARIVDGVHVESARRSGLTKAKGGSMLVFRNCTSTGQP